MKIGFNNTVNLHNLDCYSDDISVKQARLYNIAEDYLHNPFTKSSSGCFGNKIDGNTYEVVTWTKEALLANLENWIEMGRVSIAERALRFAKTALKIVSYATVVLPLIALGYKAYIRSKINFFEVSRQENDAEFKARLQQEYLDYMRLQRWKEMCRRYGY